MVFTLVIGMFHTYVDALHAEFCEISKIRQGRVVR